MISLPYPPCPLYLENCPKSAPMDLSSDVCTASNITELPEELLFMIFDMLRLQTFLASSRTFKHLSVVCRQFHKICNDKNLHPMTKLITSIRPLLLMQHTSNNILATPNGESTLDLYLEPVSFNLEAVSSKCTGIKWMKTGEEWNSDYFLDEKKKAYLETFQVLTITFKSWDSGGHWYNPGTKQNTVTCRILKMQEDSNPQLCSLAKKIQAEITILKEKAKEFAAKHQELKEQYGQFSYLFVLSDTSYSLQA